MLVAHFLLGRDGEGCGVGDVLTYTNPNPEIGTTSSFFYIHIEHSLVLTKALG